MAKIEDKLVDEWVKHYREKLGKSKEKNRRDSGNVEKIKENLKAQGFLSWCSLVVAVLALLKAILF